MTTETDRGINKWVNADGHEPGAIPETPVKWYFNVADWD